MLPAPADSTIAARTVVSTRRVGMTGIVPDNLRPCNDFGTILSLGVA
jgi:hypothetical protein